MEYQVKHLKEVYKNNAGAIFQCDKASCLWLHFQSRWFHLDVRKFYRLSRALIAIDLSAMLSTSDAADIEILHLIGTDICLMLTIDEIIAFKDLIGGSKAMLELNSIIKAAKFSPVDVLV